MKFIGTLEECPAVPPGEERRMGALSRWHSLNRGNAEDPSAALGCSQNMERCS